MRALIFDPFSGASGDMTLGALLDLGLPLEWLRDFVAGLRLGDIGVDARRVDRLGIACTQVILEFPPEHAHRHLADIVEIIDGLSLDTAVRDQAVGAFTLLAEAEASVHGTTADRVHFHEVGALDAIVDIVGAIAGVAELGFDACFTRPVALGRGWAMMEHGRFPVPPPAVLKILEGIKVGDLPLEGECTTPTGAVLIKQLTGGLPPPATFVPVASGFGAGSRNPDDRPNCLRLIAAEVGGSSAESLVMLQADMDDIQGEYIPPLVEAVLAAGALDCSIVPIQMKKGRPGLRVEALIRPEDLNVVRTAIFENGSTIGVRWWPVSRGALPRRTETIAWQGQEVRVKRSQLPDGGERVKPEFEDVVRAAHALGITPYEAYRALAEPEALKHEN